MYMFYEKPTGAPVTILETSAASLQGKMSTLTQEVTRRLCNTMEDLRDEKTEILNTFCRKLKKSGYTNQQTISIISSGVVGHARRRERLGKEHREGLEHGWGQRV